MSSSDKGMNQFRMKNPAVSALYGFDSSSANSFLPCFSGGDYARIDPAELRRVQNREAAQRAVVKGVERLRHQQTLGAIQAFNEALNFDDSCVDAYVARGAALANDGKYEAAVSDLEKALNINNTHQNARQYMIDTLLAWGKSLKEAGDSKGTRDKYEKALLYDENGRVREVLEEFDAKDNVLKRKASNTLSRSTDRSENGTCSEAKRLRAENAAKLKKMEAFIAQLKK